MLTPVKLYDKACRRAVEVGNIPVDHSLPIKFRRI